IHIYIGGKENKGIKNSAVRIQESVPEADMTELPGLYHGEFSINYPDEYVQKIDDILRRHSK
ncbi:MAG: alpha/beta hydrolase, partial [Lachnospiraceae bacterium]|nr:alpha/beta hydrolase [Lachnospiraceae bacterium]